MRHVLSVDEIDEIINRSEHEEIEWKDDAKDREKVFGEIISGGDRAKILWIIKVLSIYKRDLEDNKRKFYASDAKLLATAEKIIIEEFAFVLGIGREQVLPYILEKIGKI